MPMTWPLRKMARGREHAKQTAFSQEFMRLDKKVRRVQVIFQTNRNFYPPEPRAGYYGCHVSSQPTIKARFGSRKTKR